MESIARKAHDVSYALKRVLTLGTPGKGDASRVAVPKALAEEFISRYGRSVRWEQHERGLLLISAMPVPDQTEQAWQNLRIALRMAQDAGYPLEKILERAQVILREKTLDQLIESYQKEKV